MELDNLKLRSEEVQDILSKPPHSLVRYGSAVIGVIIFVFFAGSFFFRYPDIIQSNITITTENPPTWIIARATGKLKNIYVKDRQAVYKNELLAVIDNPSNTQDILFVKQLLKRFQLTDSVTAYSFPKYVDLGAAQSAYSAFRKALNEYQNFIHINLYQHKIQAIQKQLKGYNSYTIHLQKQIDLSKKNNALIEKEYGREKQLYEKDLSTLSALEDAEKAFLSAQQTSEQLSATLSNVQIEVAKLENDLLELQLQKLQETKVLKVNLQTALESLNAVIREWELTYVLQSPIEGTLSFNNIWKENQNINSGEKIFSIVNGASGKIIGRLQFPLAGSGKVKIGQRVNIKLNNYPYMEYGYLTGKVKTISLLPEDNQYTAVIEMPQNLKTTYNKELSFNGELSGIAEITTDDRSLASRLLSPFRYIFNRNFHP